MRAQLFLGCTMVAYALAAYAAEPLPFRPGSLEQIKARYAGRPFILGVWSVDRCGHCITELTMLGYDPDTQDSYTLGAPRSVMIGLAYTLDAGRK